MLDQSYLQFWFLLIVFQLRDIHGFYGALTKEMEEMDPELFFKTYWMDKEHVNAIATLVQADIVKEDTIMRPANPVKAHLAVTLR